MDRTFFMLGSAFAFLAVLLGAFGAHALRDRLSVEMMGIFETGVRYHFMHALGLLATAWASSRWSGGSIVAAGWLFAAGIVIFSGSLYLLSLTGARWLGAITPIGGAAYLLGWLFLFWGVSR